MNTTQRSTTETFNLPYIVLRLRAHACVERGGVVILRGRGCEIVRVESIRVSTNCVPVVDVAVQ